MRMTKKASWLCMSQRAKTVYVEHYNIAVQVNSCHAVSPIAAFIDSQEPMRNITLSADADTIDVARQRAASEHTTLNAEFRKWLHRYARRHQAAHAVRSLRELRGKYGTGGRKFTRDEMNER